MKKSKILIGLLVTNSLLPLNGLAQTDNTTYGTDAGDNLSTGDYNSFFGNDAGKLTTSGSSNTFIGEGAGLNNISGSNNAFIGRDAGNNFTSGYYNIFLGTEAGMFSNYGNHNIFLGHKSGRINFGAGSSNVFIGSYAGYELKGGNRNVGIGYEAGRKSRGDDNTFLGYQAGKNNSTGGKNIFIGKAAGLNNSDGNENTFIGSYAGYANGEGEFNTFIGYASGYANKGSQNTFIGNKSGYYNNNGIKNTFIGEHAGFFNKYGVSNTFIGKDAGYSSENGQENTFIGESAGYSNTTGGQNIFVGKNSGYSNTSGNFNTFLGYESGYNSNGLNNTFIGYQAGKSNTTGSRNSYIGHLSGYNNTEGSNNVFLGYLAGSNETSSNKLYIAYDDDNLIYGDFVAGAIAIDTTYLAKGAALTVNGGLNLINTSLSTADDGTMRFNGSDVEARIGGSWVSLTQAGNLQELDLTNDILSITGGINPVNLTPYLDNTDEQFLSFATPNLTISNGNTVDLSAMVKWNDGANNDIYRDLGNVAIGTNDPLGNRLYVNGDAYIDGDATVTGTFTSSDERFKKNIQPIAGAMEKIMALKGKSYQFKLSQFENRNFPDRQEFGFIAQELQEIMPHLVKEDTEGYLAVNYTALIPVLVEALKEMNTENEALKLKVQEIEDNIQFCCNTSSNTLNSNITGTTSTSVTTEVATLQQNVPNPFKNGTKINFKLPKNIQNAAIYIHSLDGERLMTFNNLISISSIEIQGDQLAPGTYTYSLVVDGRMIDTKLMLLSK